MNATMFAFSYKYGFISRGLIGTIYQGINKIVPFDMMNYTWIVRYNFVATVIYVLLLCGFYCVCLKRCRESIEHCMQYIIILLTIFAVPIFVGQYNFGRSDMYCVIVSLLAVMLIITQKVEWLVIPLAALGVMVHQGYVFMYANVILVLLLYRFFRGSKKDKIKYGILFLSTFLVISILFLYFELFSHADGETIYGDIVHTAKAICKDGWYHIDVIDKEILGIDLTEREIIFHKYNIVQFPIFLLLMFPHIILVYRFFTQIIQKTTNKVEKYQYILISVGALTMLPDLLLKVDYGRWMFAIIFYYLVVILVLMSMNDSNVINVCQTMLQTAQSNRPYWLMLLLYPILLQPLGDVNICEVTEKIANVINYQILHWWTV